MKESKPATHTPVFKACQVEHLTPYQIFLIAEDWLIQNGYSRGRCAIITPEGSLRLKIHPN